MKIAVLRSIGEKLLREIGQSRRISRESLGIGASGDRTYPIDRMSEDIIFSMLEKIGEPLTVISEEIGVREMNGGGTIVLIDPIDGSRNAIAGIPFYGTSLAVARGERVGDICMSYVLNLVTGDEFWAEKNGGAFMNGERMRTQHDDVLYVTAYEAQAPSHDIPRIVPLLRASRKTRCLGATALDIAYLAGGAISVFANPSPSRSFDFAGGWLLVQEAGGVFTDMDGNSIDRVALGLKRSTPLLAAGNARLHGKALALLGRGA